MLNYINKVRQKPEHHRKRTAFVWSFCITLILALAWVATLPVRFTDSKRPTAAAIEALNEPVSTPAISAPDSVKSAEDANAVIIVNSSN